MTSPPNPPEVPFDTVLAVELHRAYYCGLDKKGYSQFEEDQAKQSIRTALQALIGEDEELPNTLGFLSEISDAIENAEVEARNAFRQFLRDAITKGSEL